MKGKSMVSLKLYVLINRAVFHSVKASSLYKRVQISRQNYFPRSFRCCWCCCCLFVVLDLFPQSKCFKNWKSSAVSFVMWNWAHFLFSLVSWGHVMVAQGTKLFVWKLESCGVKVANLWTHFCLLSMGDIPGFNCPEAF